MIIANPIYDVVFKYLLEDTEIAKELLSTILGANISGLQVKPQETLIQGESGEIKIFHLDFKAVIDLPDGKQKTVLIELQKAKKTYDILRFRKYLGENYSKEEIRKNKKGKPEGYCLEIVTIYFLGFTLSGVEVPVLKVSRNIQNAITGETVVAENDFINHLTHECFTIQIPRLAHTQGSKLEEVLAIFSQDNITDDLHKINYTSPPKNPLAKKIIRRLSKAAGNQAIQRIMDTEDLIERLINRETAEKTKEIEAKLTETEKLLQESEREKEALHKQIEDLLKKKKENE